MLELKEAFFLGPVEWSSRMVLIWMDLDRVGGQPADEH